MMRVADPASAAAPCEYLEWDSTFFGMRIGRVRATRLTDPLAAEIVRWARQHAMDCLYLFAEAGDRATVVAAERHGFSLVDWRLTFAIDLPTRAVAGEAAAAAALVRPAAEGDLPALKGIARESHTDTRFYFDGRFPRERCDSMYEIWIERSCHGGADLVLVPEVDGAASGYVTCHLDGGSGRIGLVGVHPRARGRGIAGLTLGAALDWFGVRRATRVSVVTQGRNLAAARLYERCGFTMTSAMVGYHWWSNQSRP
jgi:GNAT superfamily N-acetyltransferase